MKNQKIRDHIFVRIRDPSLSAHLQREGELTLDKAKRVAIKEQEPMLKDS